jgi:hypothetical protein
MMGKEAAKRRMERKIADIKKELMNDLDYRTLNSLLPYNSISSLVYEILEAGYISKELQARIGKILGERWMKWK